MPEIRPNSQYNIARPDSLPIRVAAAQRRVMFDMFVKATGLASGMTILDVGVTSDRSYSHSNYLESWYPEKSAITALGMDDAGFLEEIYPGVKFVIGSGLALPFDDQSFEVIHSSAVIEHVGSRANQIKVVEECARVARRAFFLTTPNRWFPIEFHTILPLVHWLPQRMFRAIISRIGYGFFAKEENLNLLTSADLAEIAREAHGLERFSCTVSNVRLLGWPSNLLLMGLKRDLG